MVAVTVAWRPRESRDHDVRPERTHHRHHIVQHRVLWPVLAGFIRGLRESEIVLAPEILVRPIDSTRSQELLGADDTQGFSQLVSNQVLPTVAARERHVGGVDVSAARQPGDEIRVLVIRMRGDPENAHRVRGRDLHHRIACGAGLRAEVMRQ